MADHSLPSGGRLSRVFTLRKLVSYGMMLALFGILFYPSPIESQEPASPHALFLILADDDPYLDESLSQVWMLGEVLDAVQLEEGFGLLLRAQGEKHGKLSSLGFDTVHLAEVDVARRLFWISWPGVPFHAEPPLSFETALVFNDRAGRRWLAQIDATQVESLLAQGFIVWEAGPVAPPQSADPLVSSQSLPDPRIAALMEGVGEAFLAGAVGELSGESPATIGGIEKTILTRFSGTAGMYDAADYLRQRLESLGLETEFWPYGTRGWINVVATQPGTVHPERVYIICAHYDSIAKESPEHYAPGADDNASGSAAVLAAAEKLSALRFENTIQYILFSGEEQGLKGSRPYAFGARRMGEEIFGVINLDMIAWDSDEYPRFQIHARDAASEQMATLFQSVIISYGLGLDPVLKLGSTAMTFSDHRSFWEQGYPAILGIEDDGNDFNPNYHTSGDRLAALNMGFFRDASRAALGTLSHLAGPLSEPYPTPAPLPSPTPIATPACPTRLSDGGFEAGVASSHWDRTSAGGYDPISSHNPRSGHWGAWLNRTNNSTDTLCRIVDLPVSATGAQLDYWWQMWTDETVGVYDHFYLRVRRSGNSPWTIVSHFNNANLQHRWQHERVTLHEFAGQRIELCFSSTSDSFALTYFFLDDVNLSYCLPGTPTPTPTRMPEQGWFPLLMK